MSSKNKLTADCGASVVGIVTELHYWRPEIGNLEVMREFIIFKNAQASFGTVLAPFSVGTRPFFG
jgi:hypothetical protein